MSNDPNPFAAMLEEAARRGAAEALASVARGPVRITRETCLEAGSPSWRWIEDKAAKDLIAIRGPRGARYVDPGELAALLSSSRINRRRTPKAAAPCTSIVDDAAGELAGLVARRAGER